MKRKPVLLKTLAVLLSLSIGSPTAAHPELVEGYALRQAGVESEPVRDGLENALIPTGLEERYGIGAGFRMWRWGAGEVKVVIKRRFGRKGWVALRKPLLGLGALLKFKGEGRAAIQEVFHTLSKAAGFMSPAQLEKLVSLVNRLVEEGVKPAHLFGWMRFVSVLVEIGQTSPNAGGAGAFYCGLGDEPT